MTGIGMMLKALGVNVTEQHVKAIEVLIPQIPARLNQAVEVVNAAITRQDERLTAIETRLEQMEARMRGSFMAMAEANEGRSKAIVAAFEGVTKALNEIELQNGRIETEVQHGRTTKRANSHTTTRSHANGSDGGSADSSGQDFGKG